MRNDPIAALNQTLSEVIDMVLDVKQARWMVPGTHPLHAQLDQLFDDLRTWAQLLVEQDEAFGVSPLDGMPSVAGRKAPNLGGGNVTDEGISRIVAEHLDQLAQHIAATLPDQQDDGIRAALGEVERGVNAQRQLFGEHRDDRTPQ